MTEDTVTVTTEHKDFNQGYQLGIDTLEQLTEKVEQDTVEHEPLILLGIITVLLECAFRSLPVESVDEMVEIAKELAESAAEEPLNRLQ